MLWVQIWGDGKIWGDVCRVAFLPASKPLMVVGKAEGENQFSRQIGMLKCWRDGVSEVIAQIGCGSWCTKVPLIPPWHFGSKCTQGFKCTQGTPKMVTPSVVATVGGPARNSEQNKLCRPAQIFLIINQNIVHCALIWGTANKEYQMSQRKDTVEKPFKFAWPHNMSWQQIRLLIFLIRSLNLIYSF